MPQISPISWITLLLIILIVILMVNSTLSKFEPTNSNVNIIVEINETNWNW